MPIKQPHSCKVCLITLILFFLLLGALIGYIFGINNTLNGFIFRPTSIKPQTACTMEAKLCPDGSSVGRSGPNCEFSPCPTTSTNDTSSWKTYRNEKYRFEFKYPNNFAINKYYYPSPEEQMVVAIEDHPDNAWSKGVKVITMVAGHSWVVDQEGTIAPCSSNDFDTIKKRAPGYFNENQKLIYGLIQGKTIEGYQRDMTNPGDKMIKIARFYPMCINNKYFIISYNFSNYQESEIEQKNDLLNQILSTFKFLDQ